MDPNANLREVRDLVENDDPDSYYELVGLIDGLDRWLTYGGFLPDEWEERK